jgi:hypothetical protein
MEEYISENVVARLFLGLEGSLRPHIRDHSNIARAQAALGVAGWEEVNHCVVAESVRLGFGKPEILSSDTTVQEPQIGYPNEPSILRGIAQRVYRAVGKLQKRGLTQADSVREKAKQVLSSVKHYHLFAKTKPEKDHALKKILRQSQQLVSSSKQLIKAVGGATNQTVQSALEKVKQMGEVSQVLIPQIQQWMKTTKVAKQKILHAGITSARAIVKKTAGKKVWVGLKWLINRIGGGYVFGTVVEARADERKMPLVALEQYRAVFGPGATPEMEVYDRGGSCCDTVEKLVRAGVKKVGIQPAGKSRWCIAEEDQQEVKSQRGKTEGSIGTLKSKKYSFHHCRERSNQTVIAAGERAMGGMNLNNLIRDIVEKENRGRQLAR